MFAGATHETASALVQILDTLGLDLTQFTVNELIQILQDGFIKGQNAATGNTLSANNGISLNLLPYLNNISEKENTEKGHIASSSVNLEAGTFTLNYNSVGGKGPQGTIDLVLNPNSNSVLAEKMGVNNINASLKNYSDITAKYGSHSGISIVSEVPMDVLLGIMNTDFVNHYLNLLGAYGGKAGSTALGGGLTGYEEAYNQFLWAAAIRGLMGTDLNNQNDVLIINNRQTQQVFVISTSFLRDEQKFQEHIQVNSNPTIAPDFNK